MAPTYADIVDPHLRLVTPSQFELTLLVGDGQQVDVPRGVLVQRHGLQQNVVVVCLGGDFVRQINDFVNFLPNFKRIGVHLLADLTFKSLPVEGPDIHVLGGEGFLLLLSKHPVL